MNTKTKETVLARAYFPNDGRKLRGFVLGLLKSKIAIRIERTNYVKAYCLDDKDRIVKDEIKLLDIFYPESGLDKLVAYFEKNHPDGANGLRLS